MTLLQEANFLMQDLSESDMRLVVGILPYYDVSCIMSV